MAHLSIGFRLHPARIAPTSSPPLTRQRRRRSPSQADRTTPINLLLTLVDSGTFKHRPFRRRMWRSSTPPPQSEDLPDHEHRLPRPLASTRRHRQEPERRVTPIPSGSVDHMARQTLLSPPPSLTTTVSDILSTQASFVPYLPSRVTWSLVSRAAAEMEE